ncbi:MAG: hypothetical protein ABJE95_19380 [Byssovorax sp.]
MRTLSTFSLALPVALFLVACSGGDTSGTGGSGGSPGPAGFQTPAAGKGIQLALKLKVAPGKEVHVCREFVLPGNADLEIARMEHQYSTGGHHVLAYRSSTPPAGVSPDVFDCGNVAGRLFYETQQETESTSYPAGVGVKFDKGEVVRIELHYLNTTSAETEPEAKLNLWFAESKLTTEAGSFFMYDRDIAIPAHGKATTKMHCEIPADIMINSILPHVHTRGTAERIYISGKGLDAPKLIVSSKGYDDLETRSFKDAPIAVKAGQALDYECDFQNDTDQGIVEGPSKLTNEMCMILGDYYPRLPPEAEWCTMVGSGTVHTGALSCPDALSCIQAKMGDGNFDGQMCFVDVCPASSQALDDMTNCGFNKCPKDCPGATCGDCVALKCFAEYGVCQAATCAP